MKLTAKNIALVAVIAVLANVAAKRTPVVKDFV